jgi:hypothetical protein
MTPTNWQGVEFMYDESREVAFPLPAEWKLVD